MYYLVSMVGFLLMVDDLLLISGNDIPFPQGRVTIHQPSLKEIAYLTEEGFWRGCELLKFNKEILADEDKVNLSNISNFNIIMTMIQEKNLESQKAKINVLSLLTLLFPSEQIQLQKDKIILKSTVNEDFGEINQNNFEIFKDILVKMFCLNSSDNKEYDPQGDLAKKIANQIKRGREKKAKLASDDQKIAILSRYVSVLAVGEGKNINDLMGYTIYQLMDEFNRFQLKLNYDHYLQFKCAGASDMKEPEDWFKDIHSNKPNEKLSDIL